MTEAQYVGILIAFAVTLFGSVGATLTALLINNARMGDFKDALRSEIAALRAEVDSKIAGVHSQMATYQMDLVSKIAELDHRIARFER
ncbi:MAG TPA: hypothetical protein VKV17_12080 [Bryobacteraceae bacterium]|nr:hypothetical protein [Bryobacteraceae bacterium]